MSERIEENERAGQSSTNDQGLRQELLDGPPPGWRRSGETAVKGAGVELEKALVKHYGGDPERDIHEKIVLSEN